MWNHMSGLVGDYGWGWALVGVLHMIDFWVLVIGGIWLLVGEGRVAREKTPLDILKERHARGEMDKAGYEACKADLEH